MSDLSTQQSNLTTDVDYGGSPPTVWNIIKGHIGTMVDQALLRSHVHVSDDGLVTSRFKLRLENFLGDPLSHVNAGLRMNRGFHTLHEEIKGAVEGAVDSAMHEFNMTATNSSVKESLVTTLDSEIELDVFNEVYRNATGTQGDNLDFFHSLPIKDETMFVALVSMGVIVPIIFFTLLIIFFYKRHKDFKIRRQEMLLSDQPEFTMDDYTTDGKSALDEGVPNLDFKRLRV